MSRSCVGTLTCKPPRDTVSSSVCIAFAWRGFHHITRYLPCLTAGIFSVTCASIRCAERTCPPARNLPRTQPVLCTYRGATRPARTVTARMCEELLRRRKEASVALVPGILRPVLRQLLQDSRVVGVLDAPGNVLPDGVEDFTVLSVDTPTLFFSFARASPSGYLAICLKV